MKINHIEIVITLLLMGGFIYFALNHLSPELCREKNEDFVDKTFSGKIYKIGIDSMNQMSPTIFYQSNDKNGSLELTVDTSHLYKHARLGNLVIKKSGSNEISLISESDTIYYSIYFDCY